MKSNLSFIRRAVASVRFPNSRKSRIGTRMRKLYHEQLESRRVLTLPATLSFAEGDMIVYNGPTVDSVNDTPSFDAFIDFASDTDSFYFAPQFSGTYTINVGDFGNTVDPEVGVYIASTGARIGYNDDLSAFNDDAQLVINLVADVRYIIAVADFPATTSGNISVIVSAAFRTGSFLLTPDAFGDASTPVLLDVNTDIDYYSIVAPSNATGNLTVTATASTLNQRFALFNASGTLISGPAISINVAGVNPGQEYRIAVYSLNYATLGTLTLNVNFATTGAAVTNTLDSGPGSLRQAILDANAHPNDPGVPDKIRFAIPGVGPFTIPLISALPTITDAVDIDGNTQAGTGATPTVAIDGTGLAGAIDGLRILANDTIIRKLNIRKFPSDGIEVQASRVILDSNTIGTDWGGVVGLGNAENGVLLLGIGNRVDSNLIAGNGFSGIAIVGDTSDGNTLNANLIGARFGGNVALPNARNGISVVDGDLNAITNNTISGNTLAGIGFSGNATLNTVTGNKIGTRASGNAALPNVGDGILIQSPGNTIGGTLPALRNIISGNGKSGIAISGATASNNTIQGNYIGVKLNGTAAIPNADDGIRVTNAANAVIGSTTVAGARNVISGNGASGIAFVQAGSTGGVVAGNLIGTSANGAAAVGNTGNGILLTSGATNIEIGGSSGIAQNVIAANGANGIVIGVNSNSNRVSRNKIGTTLAGAPLGNAGSGVFVQSASNTIGGINAAFANTIAGNTQGVTLSGAGATNNTLAFNTIGTDVAPNIGRGIQFVSSASSNIVGPNNTIRRNETGILVNDGSIRNSIRRNLISENLNLGIDLAPSAGATPNDGSDADVGGNLLQNFPAISGSPLVIGANLEVAFRVTSLTANAAYPLSIDFYLSDGGGEGSSFLGTTIYTAANFTTGIKTINFAGAGAGLTAGVSRIVGVATDANGNTSEFSPQRTVAAGVILSALASQDASIGALADRSNAAGMTNAFASSGAVASENTLGKNVAPSDATVFVSSSSRGNEHASPPKDIASATRQVTKSTLAPHAMTVDKRLEKEALRDTELIEFINENVL